MMYIYKDRYDSAAFHLERDERPVADLPVGAEAYTSHYALMRGPHDLWIIGSYPCGQRSDSRVTWIKKVADGYEVILKAPVYPRSITEETKSVWHLLPVVKIVDGTSLTAIRDRVEAREEEGNEIRDRQNLQA